MLNVSDSDSVTSTATALSDLTSAHETENVNSLDALVERCLDNLDKKYIPIFTDLISLCSWFTFPPHTVLMLLEF